MRRKWMRLAQNGRDVVTSLFGSGSSGLGKTVMDEAIRKAGVLIEALEWIRRFRDRYVVIKLGGSTLEDEAAVRGFLTDVVFMEAVGMKPIAVSTLRM